MRDKEVRQDSLSGGLDTRNPNGSVDPSSYRLLINIDGGEARSMQRLAGWVHLGHGEACENNHDLHDQMLGGQTYSTSYTSVSVTSASETICGPELLRPNLCDESVQFLKEITSQTGRRRLMAGTRSRIYVSDDRAGSWRILADGLGGACNEGSDCDCNPVHMQGATLGNTTVLVNNVDPVMLWEFDSSVAGCNQWAADYVTELLALGVRTAEFVCEFQGFIFIANVIMDGVRIRNRILWSDFNAPHSWTPGGESLAAFTELGSSENILGMKPIGGKLRVYTDQAIYDGVLVGDSQLSQAGLVFAFKEIYRGTAIPKYKNTLIATKNHHYFLGEDELYRMAEYDVEPTAFAWMHNAVGAIFNGIPVDWIHPVTSIDSFTAINREMCDMPVSGWRERDQSLWISWPESEFRCPSKTMILWPDLQKATLVDAGFSAFCQYTPSDAQSLRDYLGEIGLCDPADTVEIKEGSPCPQEFVPQSYSYLWNETEDPSLPMGEEAVLANLCNVCIEDICRTCTADTKFIMADAEDFCLKEYAPGTYYREGLSSKTTATFPDVGTATYFQGEYTSLIQTDNTNLGTSTNKKARAIRAGYTAEDQEPPSNLNCMVGGGEDPGCVQWETATPEPMACTAAATGLRPQSYARFGFYTTGAYLAWRLFVEGTGGQFALNSVAFRYIPDQNKW